jgi:hypothetical protein
MRELFVGGALLCYAMSMMKLSLNELLWVLGTVNSSIVYALNHIT